MQKDNSLSPRLILHIPHSSLHIPFMDGFVENEELIRQEMVKLTDWCTDLLFFSKDDIMLLPDYSRLFCDVERFADDCQEVMAQSGMGVLYEKTDKGELLRTITPELREKIMRFYYRKHHANFTEAVKNQLEQHYQAVIIDCHSFSDVPFERDLNKDPNRPDINIGTDPFHTPGNLLQLTREYFESAGYSVGINWPYAGTIVPESFYLKEKRVHSIMIEVNRKLYLNETSDDPGENYYITEMAIRKYLRMVKENYGFIEKEEPVMAENEDEEKKT
ncbi:MAG: N-formylglutamate amidohydrolase [Bacteroidales bacterium]|nr:N-formylglutamate amidohydrolase [Bacteroidales bacterium]